HHPAEMRVEGNLLHVEACAQFPDVILNCAEVDDIARRRDDQSMLGPCGVRNAVTLSTAAAIVLRAEEPRMDRIAVLRASPGRYDGGQVRVARKVHPEPARIL